MSRGLAKKNRLPVVRVGESKEAPLLNCQDTFTTEKSHAEEGDSACRGIVAFIGAYRKVSMESIGSRLNTSRNTTDKERAREVVDIVESGEVRRKVNTAAIIPVGRGRR